MLGWSGVVSAARTSRTDKAIGPPLGEESFSALLLGAITTEEVRHAQAMRPSDSTHTLIMGRGSDTCGSPSSYAGYADHVILSHEERENLLALNLQTTALQAQVRRAKRAILDNKYVTL